MKRLSLIIAAAFVLSIFAVSVFAASTLEFSIPLPLTGAQAKFGEMEKRSYEMAAEEINAKGGIKGKKVVLKFEDSQGKP
jgi:branched-chain amino acid transport system substrate-binding protein